MGRHGAAGRHDAEQRHLRNFLPEVVSRPVTKLTRSPRFAYAMMAYDEPGQPLGESMWGAIAMARALQRLSDYPLLLLTNSTELPDGTDVVQVMKRLNAKVLPVYPVHMPGAHAWTFRRWNIAFWKLQIFLHTDYDKIIWLDGDSTLYRSVDWIFHLDGMWGQRDDWFCKLNQTKICSGILSVIPSVDDFDGMLKYAGQVGSMLTLGDQQLIEMYFRHVAKKPVNFLDDATASFGQCIGTVQQNDWSWGTRSRHNAWITPAFVHKSGGWGNTNNNAYSNVCFSHNMSRQRYVVGGVVLNACHFNPLAAHWRSFFCEAHQLLQTDIHSVKSFCSDACYYHGQHADGVACLAGAPRPLRGAISGSTGHRYPAHILPELVETGKPAPEAWRAQHLQPTPKPPKPAGTDEVNFLSLEMATWNCRGVCPSGGCCDDQDCALQCEHNPEISGRCQGFKFDKAKLICRVYAHLEPFWSSEGGHSGPNFQASLVYPGASLPAGGFTVTAKIRSKSHEACQDIMAWGDGEGSWMSVEFRLNKGNLLYGENPHRHADADTWRQVESANLQLNNGLWQDVAVSRHSSGEVALFVNGFRVQAGRIMRAQPVGLLPRARSCRVARTRDCIFKGQVTSIRIYDRALSDDMMYGLARSRLPSSGTS
uniref:LamG-like jellyroll fold domain-containing protein n=1 Tax=Zooxanthella nutricula TaxID=1333877 RepID=A0A7S2PS89_9DINO